MGKVSFRRRRVEWETVETWDLEVLEDGHIRDYEIAFLKMSSNLLKELAFLSLLVRKRNPRTSIVGRYGARSSTRTKSTRCQEVTI
jgi:hypothetical protein